jgi:hypothetical protein
VDDKRGCRPIELYYTVEASNFAPPIKYALFFPKSLLTSKRVLQWNIVKGDLRISLDLQTLSCALCSSLPIFTQRSYGSCKKMCKVSLNCKVSGVYGRWLDVNHHTDQFHYHCAANARVETVTLDIVRFVDWLSTNQYPFGNFFSFWLKRFLC